VFVSIYFYVFLQPRFFLPEIPSMPFSFPLLYFLRARERPNFFASPVAAQFCFFSTPPLRFHREHTTESFLIRRFFFRRTELLLSGIRRFSSPNRLLESLFSFFLLTACMQFLTSCSSVATALPRFLYFAKMQGCPLRFFVSETPPPLFLLIDHLPSAFPGPIEVSKLPVSTHLLFFSPRPVRPPGGLPCFVSWSFPSQTNIAPFFFLYSFTSEGSVALVFSPFLNFPKLLRCSSAGFLRARPFVPHYGSASHLPSTSRLEERRIPTPPKIFPLLERPRALPILMLARAFPKDPGPPRKLPPYREFLCCRPSIGRFEAYFCSIFFRPAKPLVLLYSWVFAGRQLVSAFEL